MERSTGIVFGGSNFGLLGVMAAEAVKNNGIVTGIIPEFFLSECRRECACMDHPLNYWVCNLCRKQILNIDYCWMPLMAF